VKNKEAIRDRMVGAIYRAINAVNELLPIENQLLQSPDERLIGPEGKLDSLGYINLVIALEQEYENEFGFSLSLSDEGLRRETPDPFQTISTLADFLLVRHEDKLKISK